MRSNEGPLTSAAADPELRNFPPEVQARILADAHATQYGGGGGTLDGYALPRGASLDALPQWGGTAGPVDDMLQPSKGGAGAEASWGPVNARTPSLPSPLPSSTPIEWGGDFGAMPEDAPSIRQGNRPAAMPAFTSRRIDGAPLPDYGNIVGDTLKQAGQTYASNAGSLTRAYLDNAERNIAPGPSTADLLRTGQDPRAIRSPTPATGGLAGALADEWAMAKRDRGDMGALLGTAGSLGTAGTDAVSTFAGQMTDPSLAMMGPEGLVRGGADVALTGRSALHRAAFTGAGYMGATTAAQGGSFDDIANSAILGGLMGGAMGAGHGGHAPSAPPDAFWQQRSEFQPIGSTLDGYPIDPSNPNAWRHTVGPRGTRYAAPGRETTLPGDARPGLWGYLNTPQGEGGEFYSSEPFGGSAPDEYGGNVDDLARRVSKDGPNGVNRGDWERGMLISEGEGVVPHLDTIWDDAMRKSIGMKYENTERPRSFDARAGGIVEPRRIKSTAEERQQARDAEAHVLAEKLARATDFLTSARRFNPKLKFDDWAAMRKKQFPDLPYTHNHTVWRNADRHLTSASESSIWGTAPNPEDKKLSGEFDPENLPRYGASSEHSISEIAESGRQAIEELLSGARESGHFLAHRDSMGYIWADRGLPGGHGKKGSGIIRVAQDLGWKVVYKLPTILALGEERSTPNFPDRKEISYGGYTVVVKRVKDGVPHNWVVEATEDSRAKNEKNAPGGTQSGARRTGTYASQDYTYRPGMGAGADPTITPNDSSSNPPASGESRPPENPSTGGSSPMDTHSDGEPSWNDIADHLEESGRRGLRGLGYRLNAGLDVDRIPHLAKILAADMIRGGVKFSDWAKEMMSQHGPGIQQHLRTIWEHATCFASQAAAMAHDGASTPLELSSDRTIQPRLDALAPKMVRARMLLDRAKADNNPDGIVAASAKLRGLKDRDKALRAGLETSRAKADLTPQGGGDRVAAFYARHGIAPGASNAR